MIQAVRGQDVRVQRNANGMRRFFDACLFALPLLLAWWLYGYSITLPFFLDDGPHFQILAQTDGLRHWGDFPLFPFYRPLTFSIWKFSEVLLGSYDPVFLHLLNLVCFGLAGVVIGQIVRRMVNPKIKRPAAVMAGCAFVIFPFSYQAVAMVAALFHLTLTLGIVMCLWLALLWLDGRAGGGALIGCWLAAFVAVFSHETGVLIAPLLVGMLFITCYRQWPEMQRLYVIGLPVMLMVGIYLALWLSFSPRDETGLTTDFNAAFAVLMQGLTFPFVVVLRPFWQGDIDPALLLVLVCVSVLLFLIVNWQTPGRNLMLYGLGWYVLAVLPATLILPAGYVLGQPRLALLASAGGAIFWGVALASLAVYTRWMWPVVIVFSLVALFISVEFLSMRRVEFLRLRDYNRDLITLFGAHNVIDTGAVLVNAPDYLIPLEDNRRFLLGTEGVLFVDETLDYNQQFWMNSDLDYDNVMIIAYPQIQRNVGYGFRAHPPVVDGDAVVQAVQAAPLVYVTQFNEKGFYPVLVGGIDLHPETSANPNPLVIYPETNFMLQAAQAVYDTRKNMIDVTTQWRVQAPAPIKLFVHIYCDDEFIAQSDGYPWGDTYPFMQWSSGESQIDIRRIQLNTPVTQACLRAYAGLYRETDVTRLMAVDFGGETRYPDDTYQIPILEGTLLP